MTPWLDDGDVNLYHGDALETVRQLPDESVDCVVTSPPYWGLRDYGTGEWDGGDPDCGHVDPDWQARVASSPKQQTSVGSYDRQELRECRKCGARRVDRQMGLEPTPDLFVTNMVELFREIRRVLAPHGTCWVNLGDSYASAWACDRRNVVGNGSLENGKRENRPNRLVGGLKEKDLVGIPWRVAFALQADGWWLRSDIIWAKPNPMPESVTDRPTKAHEYVFLLTKQPRYWFDAEAVREPNPRSHEVWPSGGANKSKVANGADRNDWGRNITQNPAGRNVRSVWQIATQPYPEAHFATYPEELARRCILAGCPTRVCRVCGKPSERITKTEFVKLADRRPTRKAQQEGADMADINSHNKMGYNSTETVGWSDCGHNNWRPGLVLDPFIGSGTTAKVARDHQRHSIGIDLNEQYLELAARRLQQLSLLTGFDQ